MKKTCGALVIGLLITTNVYAKETKKFCNDEGIQAVVSSLKSKSTFLKNWKPTEPECAELQRVIDISYDIGFKAGHENGVKLSSKMFDALNTGMKCPPVKDCPPCDCSYNVPLQNNDIKRQQELDDARREQYYLDQNMNRHR